MMRLIIIYANLGLGGIALIFILLTTVGQGVLNQFEPVQEPKRQWFPRYENTEGLEIYGPVQWANHDETLIIAIPWTATQQPWRVPETGGSVSYQKNNDFLAKVWCDNRKIPMRNGKPVVYEWARPGAFRPYCLGTESEPIKKKPGL
jgi:hypothetical protein